jgi:hypothetical protein
MGALLVLWLRPVPAEMALFFTGPNKLGARRLAEPGPFGIGKGRPQPKNVSASVQSESAVRYYNLGSLPCEVRLMGNHIKLEDRL